MIRKLMSHSKRTDRGAQIVEFAAFIPFLLLALIIVMEVFASFMAVERIESAARAGARVGGPQGTGAAIATANAALPSWLDHANVTSGYTDGGVYTQVSVKSPLLWQNAPFDITLTRRVEMPML